MRFWLEAIFSPEECAKLIPRITAKRVQFTDSDLTQRLASRLVGKVPFRDISNRWRGRRYDWGEAIKPHRDGCSSVPDGLTTHTVLLYLNENLIGGWTRLEDPLRFYIPNTGFCLIFPHNTAHEATAVGRGTKFLLRTDMLIMPE